jgi:hypothetical protein
VVDCAVPYPLAPLGRRSAAWLIDAAIGGVLGYLFVRLCGGLGDVKTIWHAVTFKSVNGKAGHQLSQAMHPGAAGVSALKPIVGLLLIMTVLAVVGVAYRVVTTARWGAGIGKYLLGLRIVVDRGTATADERPSWGQAWRRWVVPQGPGLIPLPATGLLAYLPAFKDARRRGLHDRVAGTVVIDVTASAPVAVTATATLAPLDGFVTTP